MQPRRHVGELHEVLEVGERGVTPTLVDVVHERAAIVRREDRVVATDHNVVGWVSCVLYEGRWRILGDNLATHATREAHASSSDVGAGGLEDGQRFRVIADLDADFQQHCVGGVLDHCQCLFACDFEWCHRARQIWHPIDDVRCAQCGAPSATSGPARGGFSFAHVSSSCECLERWTSVLARSRRSTSAWVSQLHAERPSRRRTLLGTQAQSRFQP